MNCILASMTLTERYADAAARAESLSNQLADLRDVFDSLGLSSYADVASEMADTLTVQSIHMKRTQRDVVEFLPAGEPLRPVLVDRFGEIVDESLVTPGILAELEVPR